MPAIIRSNPAVSGRAELRLLEVDVVDDLGDRAERGIGEAEAGDEDLERDEVSFVGEFAVEHVESELAGACT